MIRLGVNVDHVATLRQARGVEYPDPVEAALIAEAAGADGITVHRREDCRHIQDRDVEELRLRVRSKLNLEMAVAEGTIALACRIVPDDVCFVPERREELTTEGGLDVVRLLDRVRAASERLTRVGARVATFIDPEPAQVEASKAAGAHAVELHTGDYANARTPEARGPELDRLRIAALRAHELGLGVHAGHGLTIDNVGPIAMLPHLAEVNIGHSIIARAVLVGMATAVREMKALLG